LETASCDAEASDQFTSHGRPHAAMTEIYPSLAQCAVVAAALKILLFPA
jgi:alpha-1,3-glucosyltransferase